MELLPNDIKNIIFQYDDRHHINFCKMTRIFRDVCGSLLYPSNIRPSSVLKVKLEDDEYEDFDNFEHFYDIFERSICLLRRFNPDITKSQIMRRIQPIEDDE